MIKLGQAAGDGLSIFFQILHVLRLKLLIFNQKELVFDFRMLDVGCQPLGSARGPVAELSRSPDIG